MWLFDLQNYRQIHGPMGCGGKRRKGIPGSEQDKRYLYLVRQFDVTKLGPQPPAYRPYMVLVCVCPVCVCTVLPQLCVCVCYVSAVCMRGDMCTVLVCVCACGITMLCG